MNKSDARIYGLQARDALSSSVREEKDRQIFRQLKKYIDRADVIGCYISMRTEVNTYPILQYCLENNKLLCVPVIQNKRLKFMTLDSLAHLHDAPFHTKEPDSGDIIPLKDINLMIVPLSAYDESYNRTGYGKGYYDTILDEISLKVGIAYKEQKVDSIEADLKDIPLDYVISA